MMTPYHQPDDQAKLDALMTSMERDGWVGGPLVTWGDDQLLTGAHRYAAVEQLVRADRIAWDTRDIPTIDISEVFAEAGVDWAQVMRDEDLDASQGGQGIDHPALGAILEHYLPAAIRDAYGIDLG